ncbi:MULTISPECIES: hypothetical protein [Bacillus]|uniref:DUF4901 domain-containing protein n=1 Tax=Bacillus capparidis TaxID=1840411 RepID=A0ABS4CYE8_9BACI|nr:MULTISPECIES: hypothetical protein [Bacillus]MBP1082393.1 hypothetical protein [Bacillus capparidis]MED1097351.1 hypothetical protein [Bacillus capparidis]
MKSRKFKSVIFVRGKSYADDEAFSNLHKNDIIKWIEQETGLAYGRQFQLEKEEKGRLFFKECIDGAAVSPSGSIEIEFDQEGKLTFFSVHGQFPSKEKVKEETNSLSLEMVEHMAKEQLKLIEFPSFKQKRLFPVYAVEEIYVMNDQTSTIPFELIVDIKSLLKIDQIIQWDTPLNKPFDRKEINLIEDVTAEQAFSYEPSPESFPITKVEQEKCVMAVRDFLRQEFPNDTGKWILKTLHRENGFIHATLRATNQDIRVFQRKLLVMIDAQSIQVLNYMDNKLMWEFLDQFLPPEKVTIDIEEAYEKIKELYELTPIYVYDFKQKQYVLCGKLDCQYGVNAGNGDVITLDDL